MSWILKKPMIMLTRDSYFQLWRERTLGKKLAKMDRFLYIAGGFIEGFKEGEEVE